MWKKVEHKSYIRADTQVPAAPCRQTLRQGWPGGAQRGQERCSSSAQA